MDNKQANSGADNAEKLLDEAILEQVRAEISNPSSKQKLAHIYGLLTLALAMGIVNLSMAAGSVWPAIITVTVQISLFLLYMLTGDRFAIYIGRGILLLFFSFLTYTFYFTDGLDVAVFWVYMFFVLATFTVRGKEGALWSVALLFSLIGAVSIDVNSLDPALDLPEVQGVFLGSLAVAILVYAFDLRLDSSVEHIVTEKTQAQQASSRLDALLNDIGEGLIATDKQGVIDFVNQQALDLLGMTRRELIGQPQAGVVRVANERGDLIRSADQVVTQVLRTGQARVVNRTSETKYHFLKADGTSFPAGMTVSPVRIEGEIDGVITLFHDISEETQMDHAKNEFVSLASHQLRTPLNVVAWYAEKLRKQKKGPLNEKQQDYVNEIYTNNERMIGLVSSILNVSRIEMGRLAIKHHAVEIVELVKSLVKEVEPLAKQKGVQLTADYGLDTLTLQDSDRDHLTVVIQNLLSNAVKYTSKGSIHVSVRMVTKGQMIDAPSKAIASHDGALVLVKDTGIGIPPDQLDKVFEKMNRATNVQDLDVQGSGLGLYVTRGLARELGGEIWVESQLGHGSTFKAYLPTEAPHD